MTWVYCFHVTKKKKKWLLLSQVVTHGGLLKRCPVNHSWTGPLKVSEAVTFWQRVTSRGSAATRMGTSSVCCCAQEGVVRRVLGPHTLLWVPEWVQIVAEYQGEARALWNVVSLQEKLHWEKGQQGTESFASRLARTKQHELSQHSPALPEPPFPYSWNEDASSTMVSQQ